MESNEQVNSVLFSVWGREDRLFRHGKEGILVLTNKRIAFVSKTKMNMDWWRDEVDAQLSGFKQSKSTIRVNDEYTKERLAKDLEDEGNMDIPIKQVAAVESEYKGWGSELKLKFNKNNKVKVYKFTLVKGWTTYPVKDPITFVDADWQPWINAARSYM